MHTWPENHTPHYASIPPLAGFRRLVNVTATNLRLAITSRASGPTSVASIGSPAIGYLRSTSLEASICRPAADSSPSPLGRGSG